MNRPLNLGLLVLGLLGLLPLRLCGLLGGVVVVGTFLLTNRTVHRVVAWALVGWKILRQVLSFYNGGIL